MALLILVFYEMDGLFFLIYLQVIQLPSAFEGGELVVRHQVGATEG